MALLLITRKHIPRCCGLSHRQLQRHQHQLNLSLRDFSVQPRPSLEEVFSPPHRHCNSIRVPPNTRSRPALSEKPRPIIGRLVLVRHGQSEWNVTDPTRDLTARFTGWADIGLTQQGTDQAVAAGRAIQLAAEKNILPSRESTTDVVDQIPGIDVAFCSLLKRASDTMNVILHEINLAERIGASDKKKEGGTQTPRPEYQYRIPTIYSWRLNERHYGALVGLSKEGAERLYGKVRLTRWRESWHVPPPPMPPAMVQRWGRERHCQPVTILRKGRGGRTCVFDPVAAGAEQRDGRHDNDASHGDGREASGMRIVEKKPRQTTAPAAETRALDGATAGEAASCMPPSESLRDAFERVLPLWVQGVAPHLRAGRTVLVVGHANTLRSLLFAIDDDVTRWNSTRVKIPSALPLVYEFVDHEGSGFLEKIHDHFGEHDGPVGTESRPIKYEIDGRECSDVVPGKLRVLKPRCGATVLQRAEGEARYRLSGTWVETDETKAVSFCTSVGQEQGEHDIA